MLCLVQQQHALLRAAGLLTSDLTTEFQTVQQLVLEAYSGPGTESCRTPDLVQEPNSESRSPGYCGPVTQAMAKRQSGLTYNLGVLPGPNGTSATVS